VNRRSFLVWVWVTAAFANAAVAQTRGGAAPPSSEAGDALAVQVFLARAGFSSGEIDGQYGMNTDKAIAAFTSSQGRGAGARAEVLEAAKASAVPALVEYVITEQDTAGPFVKVIPTDLMKQAELPALSYKSIQEALAERFQSSPALLTRLNPGVTFKAGDRIRVPNVIVETPEAPAASKTAAPKAAAKAAPKAAAGKAPAAKSAAAAPAASAVTVVVSKSNSSLTATDATGKVVFYAPVTSGSEKDPLPIGNWTVTAVARNPVFNYNPDLFWDANPAHAKTKIPPGPNGPVGVVWIDLNKEHYGIHGSPEPSRIGRTTSHGCVRLTNWDAIRLAGLVSKGTPVQFVE
jgi:lipoprotein-anchoring transpeptidase ErfK/SrfK